MIGTKIKELREKKAVSQAKLADILKINQSDISKLENGQVKLVDSELLFKIANYFNVSMDSFFTEQERVVIDKSKINELTSEQKTQIILKILDIIGKDL